MTINEENRGAKTQRVQWLVAAGGLFGALAASSCCLFPLLLFGLGVGGAWIGNFTRLAPYQPYFIAATVAFVGYGYWLAYRSSARVCIADEACARPLPNKLVGAGLIAATILIVIALGFDFLGPLLLSS